MLESGSLERKANADTQQLVRGRLNEMILWRRAVS